MLLIFIFYTSTLLSAFDKKTWTWERSLFHLWPGRVLVSKRPRCPFAKLMKSYALLYSRITMSRCVCACVFMQISSCIQLVFVGVEWHFGLIFVGPLLAI